MIRLLANQWIFFEKGHILKVFIIIIIIIIPYYGVGDKFS